MVPKGEILCLGGYFNQQGIFNENVTNLLDEYNTQPTFHRYNFRSNLDFTILKGLTANMNIAYQFEEGKVL